MRLDRWRSLLDQPGPYATVSVDTSTTDEAGAAEAGLRWDAAARRLAEAGAPQDVLDALDVAARKPAQDPQGGSSGRLLIATSAGVLADVALPTPPVPAETLWAPVPQLMPAVRAVDAALPYLLVRIDRAGADIEVHGAFGAPVEHREVEGDDDVLHKVPTGGTSQLRYQHRVEDSRERNAATVAGAVGRLERRHRPAVVLVAGDDHTVSDFVDHAPAAVAERVVRLGSGGRAEGSDSDAFRAEVDDAVATARRDARTVLVERYEQAEGRQDFAVQGLGDVVDVLRRGQAEDILLHDDASSTLHLWVGDSPMLIGLAEEDVRSMGVREPQRVRADAAIAWAALASDVGITLLEDGAPDLNDGIAATLRYADRSTPRESVPSMPGHGEPRGGEPVT